MLKKILTSELWESIKNKIYILAKGSAATDTTANDDTDDMVRERGYEPLKLDPADQEGDLIKQDEEEVYQPYPGLKSFEQLIYEAQTRPDPKKDPRERKLDDIEFEL